MVQIAWRALDCHHHHRPEDRHDHLRRKSHPPFSSSLKRSRLSPADSFLVLLHHQLRSAWTVPWLLRTKGPRCLAMMCHKPSILCDDGGSVSLQESIGSACKCAPAAEWLLHPTCAQYRDGRRGRRTMTPRPHSFPYYLSLWFYFPMVNHCLCSGQFPEVGDTES